MKIDPNASYFPVFHTIDGNWVKEPLKEYQGVPIKLAIAAQIMANIAGGWDEDAAHYALQRAETLIRVYNQTI